ncbi:C6 zinc finger domain protein [Cordyceps militaris CM01]|uniref:C6 zinc finger domain protein n=1 Tax=Cordyceps militaris (strain CM01) TaxID=983644 RepID=G3JTX1_CORMM|nr:C6 zinc finger domain protein [Cordyceps militaris CM01]EGX88125.1 C6 zinc finger domain protein [Cordyceps militaris CM01]
MEQVMEEDTATPATPTTPNPPGAVTRRKLRKGTRSCWACKHRKTSCVFVSPQDSACKGCQRRRLPCISQDVPEEEAIAAAGGTRDLNTRLARVEDLMRIVLANTHDATINHEERAPRHGLRLSNPSPHAIKAAPTSASTSPSHPIPPATTERPQQETAPLESALLPRDRHAVPDRSRSPTRVEAIAQQNLFAAFPCTQDAKLLLQEAAEPSFYATLVCTQPHSRLTRQSLAQKPAPALQFPARDAHPVIIARLMLTFAITLQCPCAERLRGLSEPHHGLIQRLTAAASTWVTTPSEMHDTLDSLLCVMLEGVIEASRGSLRRAWAVNRRAMMIAQLMGLHRSHTPLLKRIDPTLDASPKSMWFRIVYIDRHLGILLNLPQGTTENIMASTPTLLDESPLGRFERLLTTVAARIIDRNQGFTPTSVSLTRSIDSELIQASDSMPPSFWRPVDFDGLIPGSLDALLETLRVAAQVYYYGLLIQLHLPHLLHKQARNDNEEYSRMACVSAAREIVTRFTSHRSFNLVSSCSRPVDFLALLASITLLLAHIDAHHRSRPRNILAHQRQSDRSLLEQALERMDLLSNINKDMIGEKSASVIRQLLDIETEAAHGIDYIATATPGDDGRESNDTDEHGNACFRLQIPYLGTIKIACHNSVSKDPWAAPVYPSALPRPTMMVSSDASQSSSDIGVHTGSTGDIEMVTPAHDTRHGTAAQPSQPEVLADFPGITADIENWTFQGIDMAFFNSLVGETSDLY